MRKLSKERLFLVDPYNQSHLDKINNFEKNNEVKTQTSDYLNTLSNSISKETYQERKKVSNDIEESIFIEKDGNIIDYCHIHGEKDIKTCTITFYPLKNKNMKRKLPSLVADFAINTLGLEEVFIDVDENDKSMIKYLETHGFESLGLENGKIMYLKENEEKDMSQRKIA